MKNKNLFCLFLLAILSQANTPAAYAQTVPWAWAYDSVATVGSLQGFTIQSVCLDTFGYPNTFGQFTGDLYYSSDLLLFSHGGYDPYLLTYDTTGRFWVGDAQGGGSGNDFGIKILYDQENNYYVTGTFDSYGFGYGRALPSVYNMGGASGTSDIFLVKQASSIRGTSWGLTLGGNNSDSVTDMCMDGNANLYVTGTSLSPRIAFGTDTVDNSSYTMRYFISKFHNDGSVAWVQPLNSYPRGSYTNVGTRICSDNMGYLYLSGVFYDSLYFEGDTLTAPTTTSFEPFLAKLDTNGRLIWIRTYTVNAGDLSVVCNGKNEVYLCGDFSGPTMTLDTFTLYSSTTGYADVFFAKIDSGGHVKWAKSLGDTGNVNPFAICSDNNANGFVSGRFNGDRLVCNTVYGTDTLRNLFPGTAMAGFVIKFDSSGNIIFADDILGDNSSSWVIPTALVTTNKGDLYVAGNQNCNYLNFGSLTVYPDGAGVPEAFIAKIDSTPNCYTVISPLTSTTFCSGDSVVLHTGGSSVASLQWSLGGGAIAGATGSSYTAYSAGSYSVVAHSSYGCVSTAQASVSVNPMPSVGSVTGGDSVCAGAGMTLADATTGGVWSSAITALATVNAAGGVTGLAAGVDTVKYTVTNGCGTAVAAKLVTINPLPSAGTISGPDSVCIGSVITLSASALVGAWSSSSISLATVSGSGVVSAVSAGIDTIRYVVTNTCGSATATRLVTINPLPYAGTISGVGTVCVGAHITLSDAATGGSWISTSTGIAIIDASGFVTGVATGSDTMRYTVNNVCGTAAATFTFSVDPGPFPGVITGGSSVCVGSSLTLTDGITGGVWTAANAAALVSSTGSLHGFLAGTDTIIYTVTNTCGHDSTTTIVTINPTPDAGSIVGADSVCVGDTIALFDASVGGTWTTTNGNAFVSGSGIVLGVAAGSDSVVYSISNSCGNAITAEVVNVSVCSTGIKGINNLLQRGMMIYPNPNMGAFTVNLATPQNEKAELKVSSALGEEVGHFVIGTNTDNPIQLTVAPGIYFVSVTSSTGFSYARVLVQ